MADLDELYALMSDPRVWHHFPEGVHTSTDQTSVQLVREERRWELDGLGYWSARLRSDGSFAGAGGCRLYATAAWNLYYRIRPELQRHGYATELARAAIAAARAIDPARPVIASVLAHNSASRAVASAVGLDLVWEGDDPSGRRLLFSDRPIDDDVFEMLQGPSAH